MQSVYGFKQSQESNFLLTLDRIKETLHDELIKIGFEHRGKIADQEEQVVKYFKENYLHPSTSPIELEPKLFKIAEDAIRFYKTQVKRDGEEIRERMVNETEQLYVKYITLLKVMVEFAQIAEADYTNRLEKLMKVEKEKILQHLLSQNRIIAELRKNNQLSIESKRLSITLDSENLQEWYGMLKRDETFFENFRNAPDNFETQKQVLLYLVKDFLFKNESILNSL